MPGVKETFTITARFKKFNQTKARIFKSTPLWYHILAIKSSLKSEISFSALNLTYIFACKAANLFVRDFFKLSFYEFVSCFFCGFLCVIREVLFQSHKCIGVTAVENLPAFAKRHKSVAGSALTVARCAE